MIIIKESNEDAMPRPVIGIGKGQKRPNARKINEWTRPEHELQAAQYKRRSLECKRNGPEHERPDPEHKWQRPQYERHYREHKQPGPEYEQAGAQCEKIGAEAKRPHPEHQQTSLEYEWQPGKYGKNGSKQTGT